MNRSSANGFVAGWPEIRARPEEMRADSRVKRSRMRLHRAKWEKRAVGWMDGWDGERKGWTGVEWGERGSGASRRAGPVARGSTGEVDLAEFTPGGRVGSSWSGTSACAPTLWCFSMRQHGRHVAERDGAEMNSSSGFLSAFQSSVIERTQKCVGLAYAYHFRRYRIMNRLSSSLLPLVIVVV